MHETQDYQQHLTLRASPESVYAALTTLDALSAWWTAASGNAVQDGELTFTFAPGSVAVMRVAVEPNERVVWTVTECIMADWVGTTIHFDLEPSAAGTSLRFRHEGLTPQLDCYLDCKSGWDHFVPNSLRDYVETGVGHPNQSDEDLARRVVREQNRATASA